MAQLRFQPIIIHHIDQMSKGPELIASGEQQLNLFLFEENYLISLIEAATLILCKEPTLLDLDGPMVIVGDIHGHLLDLYRILTKYDLPPTTNYLFLGDIIDRGPFSLETITLILILKVLFPKNVQIIRGNHEFRSISVKCGFMDELENIYGSNCKIFDAFVQCFNYMPIAAKIGPILCVHGGLDPGLMHLQQIRIINKPITDYHDSILEGILWSDPSAQIDSMIDEYGESRRGTGYQFTEKAVCNFLKNNNLKMIVRGHECTNGYSIFFGEKLITVFSASNYVGNGNNDCGVVIVSASNTCCPCSLDRIPYIERSKARFQRYIDDNKKMHASSSENAKLNSVPLITPMVKARRGSINSIHQSIPVPDNLKKMGTARISVEQIRKRVHSFTPINSTKSTNPTPNNLSMRKSGSIGRYNDIRPQEFPPRPS